MKFSFGPTDARIMVVGEFPSVHDEHTKRLFSDAAGSELMKMLTEAGINPEEVYFTTILSKRPFASEIKSVWTTKKKEAKEKGFENSFLNDAFYSPHIQPDIDAFQSLVETIHPNIVIALGNFSLWACTGEISVSAFRGSLEETSFNTNTGRIKAISTYSPEQILKMWEWRWIAVRDLKRAQAESLTPEFPEDKLNLIYRPSYEVCIKTLDNIIGMLTRTQTPLTLSPDIETISRHIACIGIAWSLYDAICIPFMDANERHYFTLEQEFEIVMRLEFILTHPKASIVGQNWSYDTQHIVRSWLFRPRADADTMLSQHALFPGTPKDLAFLASLYCENYTYWKDELTDYRSLPVDLDDFWKYNAKDCCYTYQVHEAQQLVLEQFNLTPQAQFLQRLNWHVISMMIRGVSIDTEEKTRLMLDLNPEIEKRQELIDFMVGREINISSPKQMAEFFYEEMKMKEVRDRKTFQRTVNADALTLFGQREPILKPVTDLIEETRSIGVFLSTFVKMPLDTDKRMRCNFNVGGTETFRFSSSQNAFGSGGNLQNIPKGSEDEDVKEGKFHFPNLRKMFIPDPGFFLFDVDLAGADAQVVAWEAEDDDLKAKFRSGEKIHALNAKDIYGRDAGPDGKRAPYYKKAKMGCHLTNYGGQAKTLSIACGMTMHEAEAFQTRWFDLHPGIKTWHNEVMNSIQTTRSVSNKFGFRRRYFGRLDRILPEALAWIPQSTVALIINNALCNISENPELKALQAELLLQVHDSLVGQIPLSHRYLSLPLLRKCLAVTVPYSDPLVIGTSLDISEKSWGDLISCKWED